MTSRRQFIRIVSCTGATLWIADRAVAADMVDQKDANAVSLGYVADATQANKAKYPTYAAGQMCSTCALYQGKAGTASGPCPLFAGKEVAAKGWCSAYAKKA
ncbi:MAG: high-potential iron-sulfur protein [Proteobacteria bacterium]|nr:high-potential iron-sulfur protein [Pseudomonadota bacterium]